MAEKTANRKREQLTLDQIFDDGTLASTELERMNAALAEAVRQKDALYQLTDRLQRAQSLDQVYDAALHAILIALPCDRASILLFDDTGVMRFVAWRGLSEDYRKVVEGHSPWPPNERDPAPICIGDIETADLGDALKATIRTEGIGAAAFVPLVCNGKLIGKFMTYFNAPHVFGGDEIELSLNIARQLAFAIERRRADDALRESERRFRQIIDALPAAIYTTDAQGRLTHFNPAAVEFSGRVPDLNTDEWCVSWKLYHPDGLPLPHAQCPMAVSLKEGRAVRGTEALAERPDGERRWFMPYPTPLLDETGRVIGGINMLVDITERKQAEEALRGAARRKDEFLATLSHELRNPLAPIRQAAKLLKSPQLSERDAHWARAVIDRQVQAMGWLLDDLLDLSRISRGKLELRKEPVELASVVESALELSRPLIEAKRHTLHVELPASTVRFEADPLRLAQIISNLLTNAAKYTDPQGEIWLRVERERSELLVRVADNGIGISEDMLPKVFDMFSQATSALERTEGGLGIGLALVRGFVALHGGDVQARSEGLGRGSEFTLRLPLGPAFSDRPETHPAASEVKPVIGRRKVLVVDDNRDTAETLAALIKLQGHEVQISFNGREALEVAEAFHPDIALLDIGMPELNGYEIAQRVRKRLWGQRMTLIAVTGWGQEDDRRRAIAAGFDFHLRKPIDPDFLQSLLKESQTQSLFPIPAA